MLLSGLDSEGSEDFTIMIDHSITASTLSSSMNWKDMTTGCLRFATSDDCVKQFGTSGQTIFTVRELLTSVGINSLDDVNPGDTSGGQSYRRSGIVIGINIAYSNIKTRDQSRYDYELKPALFKTTFNTHLVQNLLEKSSSWEVVANARNVQKRRGIMLIVTSSGDIVRNFRRVSPRLAWLRRMIPYALSCLRVGSTS